MKFRVCEGGAKPVNEGFRASVDFFEISVDGHSGGEHFRGLSFFHALCVADGIALFTVFANAPL